MFCSLMIPIGFNTAFAGRTILEAGAEGPLIGERGDEIGGDGTTVLSGMEGVGVVNGEAAILPRGD